MTQPRAYRPLHTEYLTVGYILKNAKSVYEMTEEEFINSCVFYSHGAMHPDKAAIIYAMLMEEAGL